ncbi:MAG TPA: hypothetical protein PLV54_01785, partial [Anaerostipes hadrus]|nr:hypothetical protein [Anaerostipes hadrus]
GMSVVAALEAVATEYEKEQRRGNKKEIFVYEQIKKTCRQISFGVPQTKAFGAQIYNRATSCVSIGV